MLRTATTLLIVLIAGPIAAAQTVHYVDDDAAPGGDGLAWATAYDTLPPALTAAQPGDQIWVASGTYVGNFTLALGAQMYGGFDGTETLLTQRDWTINETILDGNQSGSVITGPTGATASTQIDGFTITNGSAWNGGGLYLAHSSPGIVRNAITANSASGDGGGLYLFASSPTIGNNTIMGNSANDGGGLKLRSSAPVVTNNSITSNNAVDSGGGLGLVNSSARIVDNTISDNTVVIPGPFAAGGGLYVYDSSPTIERNKIRRNSAALGGGLCLFDCSNPKIRSNWIAGNRGHGLSMERCTGSIANNAITGNGGSGVRLEDSAPWIGNNTIMGNEYSVGGGVRLVNSSPTIVNTIIAFNASGVHRSGSSGPPTLRYNCVYGNTAHDYDGLADPTGMDGNISVDPRLADPQHGNMHIQPDSPCADAGSSADAWGDFDIDGEPRTLPLAGTVDIGADESDGTVWSEGPYAIVRVSTTGDDANDGSSWALAIRSVQAGIDIAAALGGEVWVQAGTYEGCITLHSYAHVYGGFAGSETSRDERDWRTSDTILDGQQEGSVVAAYAGYRASTIDGFTITGGSAQNGGGLSVFRSSPTIMNNTITQNSADTRGGGLYVSGFAPAIAHNTFTRNSSATRGGGLYLGSGSQTITNNTVIGNTAADDGGGLYLYGSTATIVNTTITGNHTGGDGSGLYLYYSSPTVANTTITGNHTGADGGGLYLYYSSPTITNTIIAFNSSGIYQVYYAYFHRYNCVFGNDAYNFSGLSDPTGTNGNISVDPLFVREADPGPDGVWGTDDDDYGDLHLSLDSPVIDAGSNFEVPADEFDLDGDGDTDELMPFDFDGYARLVDDPLTPDTGYGSPPVVDMGAYERPRPGDCLQAGVADHDGDVDFADYVGLEACLTGPGGDLVPTCECFDLDGSGFVDLADVAVFQRSFTGE